MPEKNKQPFVKSLIQSLGEARDAKVGAVGAQQIRDAYSEGNNMWADLYAKQLTGANTLGISTPLLGSAYINSPLLKLGIDTYSGVKGAQELLSKEGVQKTYNKAKEGDYFGAAKSAIGDAMSVGLVGNGFNTSLKFISNLKNIAFAPTFIKYKLPKLIEKSPNFTEAEKEAAKIPVK